MNRALIIIAATDVLRTIGLALVLAVFVSAKGNEKEEAVCRTTECTNTATGILKNINPAVKPCDNFYEFACGGYLASAPIPDGEISVNPLAGLRKYTEIQRRLVIEEPSSPDEARPFKLAKNFYRTCMDTSALEKAGLEPLRKILRQLGNWPVIEAENWKDDHFNWVDSVCTSRELGYSLNTFVTVTINVDWRSNANYMINLDQPDFGVPQHFLIEGKEHLIVKMAYLDYMVDVAVALGANKRRATQELKETLDFAIRLANIGSFDEERRNYTLLHTPMSVSQLTKEYPYVNWKEYFNRQLHPSARVDDNEVVMVRDPKYFRNLGKLLEDTPKRVQANYALWRVIAESIDYLNKDLKNQKMKYSSAVRDYNLSKQNFTITDYKKTTSDPRWKKCLTIISDNPLSLSTNALYVRKYLKKNERQNVMGMVTDIRKELIKSLEKTDWMDEKTRKRAIEKAAAMVSMVGSSVELLDDNKLEELYADVTLRPNDFLGNYLALKQLEFKYGTELLRKPVNRTYGLFYDFPTGPHLYYDPLANSMNVPASFLQGTFFGNIRPRYMNYGAIGFWIGHAITHSFDTEGRRYDKDGRLVDWWTPETAEKYAQKSQCIIDQYNNYTVESVGRKVDGVETLQENIADNSGIKMVYLAYKEYVKRSGPEPKLPGLEYTPEQLFWISAANIQCSRYRPDSAQHELSTNGVCPARFRVIGSFANMPEFAADFNCPVGSYMNPVPKCSVL